jgi:integrase
MLREVVNGDPFVAVAARRGLSRSGVDRRIKALAVHLTTAVGVEGLRENGAAFVSRLRMHRAAILEALARFEPSQLNSQRLARVLSPDEVELGARRIRARSARPQHDLALYYLLFATGLRPLEVARLQVADYLADDGSVRRESVLRCDVAINGKSRPLFFCHRRLDDAMSAYLEERQRLASRTGVQGKPTLEPHSPLFLDANGSPYEIASAGGANGKRFVCRALLEVCRRMFRQAGVEGLCTQTARLTLMSRMYDRGADEDQVGLVLGIADRSAVREQLPRPRADLARLMED